MVKRQLDEKEITICKRNIEVRQERVNWLRFQLKYYNLMLNEGLEQNYLETIKKYKEQRREFEAELKSEEMVVEELDKQIKEGIEIKEIKEVVEPEGQNPMEKYCG